MKAAHDADKATLDLVLDAQRRLAEAATNYYQSRVEYALSVKNVHFEKGSLLDYNEIYLNEGPWPHEAYHDAYNRQSLRSRPLKINHFLSEPTIISNGIHPQQMMPSDVPDVQWSEDLVPAPAAFPETEK